MITKNINFRISRQKIKIFSKTKYLGITLEENLTFKNHLYNLRFKQNRANCLLIKIRYCIRPIHYVIFDSHLKYGYQIWGQTESNVVKNIATLHNNILRIINFKGPRTEATSLYKDSKIMPMKHIVILNNCLFVFDHLQNLLPKISKITFLWYQSNISILGNFITHKAIKQWDTIQNSLKFDIIVEKMFLKF